MGDHGRQQPTFIPAGTTFTFSNVLPDRPWRKAHVKVGKLSHVVGGGGRQGGIGSDHPGSGHSVSPWFPGHPGV